MWVGSFGGPHENLTQELFILQVRANLDFSRQETGTVCIEICGIPHLPTKSIGRYGAP
jgi:hypothetical protein